MKAIRIHEFGPPDVMKLEEVPTPSPGAGQVRVRVHAVSVNVSLDVQMRAGDYDRTIALPYTPGIDPTGVIDAVGEGVTGFSMDDRVSAPQAPRNGGGYAEYAIAPAERLTRIPAAVDFPSATVTLRHFPTAMGQCRIANVQPGEWVLVMGAAGALASCALQVLKLQGAHVIAGAGAGDRVQAALALGAVAGINYRTQDLRSEVMRLTENKGVSVVLENVGDPGLFPQALACLAMNGRLVTVGSHGGATVPLDVRLLYQRRAKIMSGLGGDRKGDAEEALRLVAEGAYTVLIDRVLPLSQAVTAHRLVEANAVLGKVLLDPTQG